MLFCDSPFANRHSLLTPRARRMFLCLTSLFASRSLCGRNDRRKEPQPNLKYFRLFRFHSAFLRKERGFSG